MKYYITDCITGCIDECEDDYIEDLEEARKLRDKMNAERLAEGGSDEFWIIIDGEGQTIV